MELMTSFTSIAGTLKTTQEVLRIALESRDLVKNTPLLQSLSAAQQSVFALNAQLFELQNQYLETAQELAKIKQAAIERRRYTLTEITKGVFALKYRFVPSAMDAGDESLPEPEHFICQPCMDNKGQRGVLVQSAFAWGPVKLTCPLCSHSIPTGETRSAPNF